MKVNVKMIKDSTKNVVKQYYQDCIAKFGSTPKGVDWNDASSQELRFKVLLQNIQLSRNDTVFDFGCGYGALYSYLLNEFESINYFGCDIVQQMIDEAKKAHPLIAENLYVGDEILSEHDYVLISGVFNVKNELSINEWKRYVSLTLNHCLSKTKKALSVNFLTDKSDVSLRQHKLYYPRPDEIIGLLNLEPKYKLLIDHSYDLWEYTITISK